MQNEFEVNGTTYRAKRISAERQYALYRRLTPILPALSSLDFGLRSAGLTVDAISKLFAPLSEINDDEIDAVFSSCLAVVEYSDGGPVAKTNMSELLAITMSVMAINFGPLFRMERVKFEPCPESANSKGFGDLGFVELPNGKNWLFAPMQAGFCTYQEIHDGTLQIEDIAQCNDLLSVKAENEARLRYVAEQN